MSVQQTRGEELPATSSEVRERLVEALKLDLVGPGEGEALAEERLPGWVRPSNWYLTGFLIPTGTPPEKSADPDEDEDFDLVPESAGLTEESSEERKAAKKGFFPSSMGLSFLVRAEARRITVAVRWADYTPIELEDAEGKPLPSWQRQPHQERYRCPSRDRPITWRTASLAPAGCSFSWSSGRSTQKS